MVKSPKLGWFSSWFQVTKLTLIGALAASGILAHTCPAEGREMRPPVRHVAQDDYWHYHHVGNLGLTVTNYGILGQGFNNPDQPSCWYKLRTNVMKEQVEHFSYSGVWIGGVKAGRVHVSTAIYDGVFEYDDGGMEFTSSATSDITFNPVFHHLNSIDRRLDFSLVERDSVIVVGNSLTAPIENGIIKFGTTTWDTIITRSTIRDASVNNPYAMFAEFFDPNAVSHQDLICAYTDTNLIVPGTGISIPNHDPLGVHVYQETYTWKDPFADAFTILSYTVTNIPTGWEFAVGDTVVDYGGGVQVSYSSGDTIWLGQVINEPYLALWVDASVGNMNYTTIYDNSGGPGGRWNWYDNLNGFDDSRHLAFQYDFDGDAGWAQSYLGIKVLGADPRTEEWDAYYHQWTWRGGSFGSLFPMPQNEAERYEVMGSRMILTPPSDGESQQSWMLFLSCGPMQDLAPGQRFNVALAVLAGLWNGAGFDSEERRKNLNLNADWAQIAYNGEDRNGNGLLDPGEDIDGDGEITRYILPAAPPSPQLVAVPGNREVTLYWNNLPEFTVDPISDKRDFEGYRIYSSPKTEAVAVAEQQEWSLLVDYDIDYDIDTTDTDSALVGLNVGLESVRLDTPLVINGVEVHYMWVNRDLKNGWPRDLYYSVTSYDRGDPSSNLQSLESSRDANRTFAFPGTLPAESDDYRVGVYPNPYRGRAAWDGLTGRDRLIWFRHLPADCEVTIFTLSGERVDSFEHHSNVYQGDDVQRITTGASPGEKRVFSGGEHAWDLLSEDDQEIATGLYIYAVKDLRNGGVKTGKFMVIK